MNILVLAALLSAALPAHASANTDVLILQHATAPAEKIAACQRLTEPVMRAVYKDQRSSPVAEENLRVLRKFVRSPNSVYARIGAGAPLQRSQTCRGKASSIRTR